MSIEALAPYSPTTIYGQLNIAYQKSAFLTNNPVGVLSTFTYSVK